MGLFFFGLQEAWLTFQNNVILSVENARNIPLTRLPNTRRVKKVFGHKEREDTIADNLVSEVKPNQFSTRKLRLQKIVLKMQCNACKQYLQISIKRTKHFELGGDTKTKGQALQY